MKHSGVISKISNSAITVSLEGNINCESCNAKAACGISESNSKEIEIEIKSPPSERAGTFQSFKLNEGVDVVMQTELGLKAVFWAYVFPFILMIVVLVVSSNLFKEWIAGLLSLFVLIPYYFMLFVLKNSFRKAFKVSILKNNQE